jgi:hypothetical protein
MFLSFPLSRVRGMPDLPLGKLDAITRTVQFSGTAHLLHSVIFTGRGFLAGGESSTLTSGDGLSWVTVPFTFFESWGGQASSRASGDVQFRKCSV